MSIGEDKMEGIHLMLDHSDKDVPIADQGDLVHHVLPKKDMVKEHERLEVLEEQGARIFASHIN